MLGIAQVAGEILKIIHLKIALLGAVAMAIEAIVNQQGFDFCFVKLVSGCNRTAKYDGDISEESQ